VRGSWKTGAAHPAEAGCGIDPPGAVEERIVPSRDKPAFKRAKGADGGDAFGLCAGV